MDRICVMAFGGFAYRVKRYWYHLLCGWPREIGKISATYLLDLRLNAAAAFRMYQRNNGWGPWKQKVAVVVIALASRLSNG